MRVSNRTESPDPAAMTAPDAQQVDATGKPISAALAEKTAAYSKEIEPKLQDRQARKQQVTPKSNTPTEQVKDESEVKWLGGGTEPAAAGKSSANGDSTVTNVPPANNPSTAAQASPSPSKQIAILTQPGDVPQIVPEGEDVPANVGPSSPPLGSDALLQQLASKVQDNPKDLSAQLDYQLLQFLRGEPVPQMKSLSGLTTEDREVLSAVMDGLSNFRSGVRGDSNQMLSRKIRPLVELADRLRSQADLALPSAALCTRVDGYGVYEPVDPARFVGGRDHPIIIYCEVQNFSSQVNEKKQWETRLSQEMVLYTETGMPVWNDRSKSIVDLSRNRRHDFFIAKKTKLPSTLTIGRYVLKLSVTDQQSNRVAETTVPIQIVAQ